MENTNLMEKNRAMHLLLQKAANDVADFEYTAEHLHNMPVSYTHLTLPTNSYV